MQFKKLMIAMMLLLPVLLMAQEEDAIEIDKAQLKELETARIELAEAARRMAEIQRELNKKQLGLEESSRMMIQLNEELIKIEDLHELSEEEFQNAIGSRVDEIKNLRIARMSDFPPRLGVILSKDDDQLTVVGVTPNSGAAEAGIESGDVLVAIDGKLLDATNPGMVREILSEFSAGDTVAVEINRDDESRTLNVVTGSSLNNLQMVMQTIETDIPGMGLEIIMDSDGEIVTERVLSSPSPLAPARPPKPSFPAAPMLGRNTDLISNHAGLEPYFGTADGVLVLRIDEDNALNLRSGDVLLRIDQEDIQRPVDLGRTLLLSGEPGDVITLEVMRDGVLTQIQGTIPEPMRMPGIGMQRRLHFERHPIVSKKSQKLPKSRPGNRY